MSLLITPPRTTETAHGPWPATARFGPGGHAEVGGVDLLEVAGRFGTPAYVMDEADVRLRCRAYRAALPRAEVAYAAKAFWCRAMASWIRYEGLALDVCSAGELAVARAAGFPPDRIIFHGNAKTPADLRAAVEQRVGRIVIDDLAEINRLTALVPVGMRQKVLVRVIPDIEAGAHAAIRTGGEDHKFGLSIAAGGAREAVNRILHQARLELVGLHCHLGSQITAIGPYEQCARVLVDQLARIRDAHGVTLPQLDLGGGHAIAYTNGQAGLAPSRLGALAATVERHCAGIGLPAPRLTVEPGRAVAGPAGVTLYRVITVKKGLRRTYVAVDGGMSDNPRPAMYGSRYEMRMIGRATHEGTRDFTVVGHHCESGDTLAEAAALPADIRPGDVLAVAATGAYNHSMASTYNMTGRPPVVAVSRGKARLVVRREGLDDLMRRDVGL